MIRILLQYLLPLLLPFALYYAYLQFGRRAARGEALIFEQVPWIWLFAAGVLLVGLTVGAMALLDGDEPGKEYVPPRTIDGTIVPGHFR